MGASECHHPEPTAPPAVGQTLCVVCKEAAVQRCEECFDDEEGHLYLCAKDACFEAQHLERQRRKHRRSLVSWDRKAQWTDKCCATHEGNVLALWCVDCSTVVCALCCLHGGEHTGHSTSLVIDAVKEIQDQLQATMEQLEDENVKNRERLRQLKEEQDGLASGNGAVGDARRALQEVKALFLAKVDALDDELDETAARWSAQVVAEHEQLARHTRRTQSLVDDVRATCAEEKAEEAQRVAIARTELCAQRDALGSAPPVSVRVMEFDTNLLRQAVTNLHVATRRCSAETANESLRSKKAVLAAVAQDGPSLRSANEEHKADKELVLAAVAQDGESLYHANKILKADKEVVLVAVAQNGRSLTDACEKLKADKEVVLAAVAQDGLSLFHANKILKADKEVVLVAVAQNGCSLSYASEKLKADKEVVLVAVAQDGLSLYHANKILKADKEVVLAAVAQSGRSLSYASEKLKADKEVALVAVAQSGCSLTDACEKLKADKEVVLVAVAQNGESLHYANKILKADKEVLVAVAQNTSSRLSYCPVRL